MGEYLVGKMICRAIGLGCNYPETPKNKRGTSFYNLKFQKYLSRQFILSLIFIFDYLRMWNGEGVLKRGQGFIWIRKQI